MPLELSSTHQTTIHIDDQPVAIRVRRLTRGEAIAFERDFIRFGRAPRGPELPSEDDLLKRADETRAFIEESIARYVTVPEGQIVDDGRSVTTGEDLIRVFCSRGDVLGAIYQAIYSENFMGLAQKTILQSRPFFWPGSTRPAVSGAAPAPIAESVVGSSSASDAPATGESDETAEGGPSPSGSSGPARTH